ncbi:KH domain-containing protein [Cryptosporidium ubiquitum]|uniref:KH domain-containing protein n=1 Tax=Cryptosporidium ubiquitum TaxID=857276 RepID=A0A1J4MIM1_9CRYT|nr:KH domain-containing protein [Cryptosporidium ubiquitum]OII74064.1 KH domain-containing protein [Cryptosporidium ubiquitum]
MAKKRPNQSKGASGKGKQKSPSNGKTNVEQRHKHEEKIEEPQVIEETPVVIDFSGLSATQKKNLKRRLKKKNVDSNSQEGQGVTKQRKPLTKKEIEAMLPNDPMSKTRSEFLSKANSRLRGMLDLSVLPIEEVLSKKGEQERELNKLLAEISETLSKESSNLKRPPKQLSVNTICEQLRDFELVSKDDEGYDEEFHQHLKELLVVASLYENYRNFQNQCNELRTRIERKLSINRELSQAAMDSNKQKRLVNKVKSLKQDSSIDGDSIETKVFELPNNKGNLLDVLFGSSSKMAKNLEKKFGALVEKSTGNSVQITGLLKDIEKCWESIRQLDFSSQETVSLDPRVIKKLYSMTGNINLKSLQDELSVIINRMENSLIILGSPESTKTVVELINKNSDISNNTVSIPVSLIVAKALQFNFLPTVRSIEKETDTSVRIQFGGKSREVTSLADISDSQPDSKILIFGKPDKCEVAKNKLSTLIKSLEVESIQADNKAVRRLFSPPGKDSSEDTNTRMSRSILDEFSKLRDSNKMGIVRIGSSVMLVGPASEIKKAKPILLNLLERAQYTPFTKTIHKDQLRVLNHSRREKIEKEASVEISTQKRQEGRTVVIEVLGSEQAKAKAESLIDEILAKEAHLEVLELDYCTYDKLYGNQRSHLRKLTSSFPNVQVIQAEKKKSSISLLGSKEEVLKLKEKFVEFNKQTLENSSNETKEIIEIPSGKMGLIIGTKGSVLNEIRSKANCESINVPKNSSHVVLQGTEEQCNIARNLISEILSNSLSNSNTTTCSEQSESHPNKVSTPESLKFDEKCFPTLGGTISTF